MKIIEPDCYIEYKDGIYHLYLLKNKKELKETDENNLYRSQLHRPRKRTEQSRSFEAYHFYEAFLSSADR